ncbi:MAG TPA: NAAT family transporter [Proteobacteria bacterium]|nr:NAAT family transporter [Pseudomonadota bacterium]
MDSSALAKFFIASFVSIFIIVNPLANISVFITMTEGDSPEKRRATAFKACTTCFVVLAAFTFGGHHVLRFFGVTVPAFRIAGGIILFMVAIQMLQVNPARIRISPEEEKEGVEKEDIAVVPLAIPMLSGPGAITTVIVLGSEHEGWTPGLLIMLSSLLTSLISYIIFSRSVSIARVLGRSGVNILTRIMGLILAVIAVEIVVSGIRGMFPRLFSV